MKSNVEIRPSPIAGQWYPADPKRLAKEVDRYMDAVQLPELPGEVVAVMAPHAGYLYSGPVAGYAFSAVRSLSVDVVAVLSPMHYPYNDPLLTTAHAAYATPLGAVEVERLLLRDLSGALEKTLGFGLAQVTNDPEHSLEIELPFLQRALPEGFTLIPLMLRDQRPNTARHLGKTLARLLQGRKALLVASTDLSHFYNQSQAKALDSELLRRVEAFDPDAVLSAEEEGQGYACGKAALAAVLWAARDLGANSVRVLKHATSGDVNGEYDRVVGYGAAVVLRRKDLDE
jgi:AmmeMemoRadiSam system protein B